MGSKWRSICSNLHIVSTTTTTTITCRWLGYDGSDANTEMEMLFVSPPFRMQRWRCYLSHLHSVYMQRWKCYFSHLHSEYRDGNVICLTSIQVKRQYTLFSPSVIIIQFIIFLLEIQLMMFSVYNLHYFFSSLNTVSDDPFPCLEFIPDRIRVISWHDYSFTKYWPPDGCSRDLDGGETFKAFPSTSTREPSSVDTSPRRR